MTALKLELSTLSTSYTSLQSTLVLLQTQLVDLKRVNNELQEENESYNILLRERTLNGQFDVLKMGGSSGEEGTDGSGGEDEDDGDNNRDAESFRSRATGRSTLDRVDEAEEHEQHLDPGFEEPAATQDADADVGVDAEEDEEEMQARNPRSRHNRKRSSVSVPRGESLANLPITGPGLDLAAELGRAENKDILDGHASLDQEKAAPPKNKKKGKKGSSDRKVSSMSEAAAEPKNEMDVLRNEVKSLKDANKALSLYASKIIDRIISQEGFEHVLAVDYEKETSPTSPTTAGFTTFSNLPKSPPPPAPAPKKARPQSAIFSLGSSSTAPSTPVIPPTERLTTFDSPLPQTASPQSNSSSPPAPTPSSRASRRSMSFDWKSFSMFGGDKKPEPTPNLRPLTLRAGTSITGARKLETYEDEDDRRERERLNATMKLMGIEPPAVTTPLGSPVPPPMLKSYSAPDGGTPTTPSTAVAPTPSNRFSFFRRTNSQQTNSETSSINSSPQPPSSGLNLTHEALEQAEAEGSLAALDAHERQLSAEIAKGGGGGFTELSRRSGDRRSSRRSGSGSTVWSAGMSAHDD